MYIKLEIKQGYSTMHGQPIIKIHQQNYANPTDRIPSTKIRSRQLVRLIFVCQGTHTDFPLTYSLPGPTLTHRNTVNASTNTAAFMQDAY